MLRCTVAILDNDEGYLEGITSYLTESVFNKFNIASFNNLLSMEQYLKSTKIDILLICNELLIENKTFIEELKSQNIVVIILSDNIIQMELINYPRINKYQNGQVIENEIIKIYTHTTTDEIVNVNTKMKEIIGLYSPIGGTGNTIMSIAIGRLLSKSNNKTLFISTEEIPSYKQFFASTHDNTFSDMIYYIKSDKKNWLMKLEGIKEIDECGLHYFNPHLCNEDIKEMSTEEWQEFIKYLMENSDYEAIIIDFTSDLSQRNTELMKMCTILYFVLNNTYTGVEKSNYFFKSLELRKIKLNGNMSIVANYNREADPQSVDMNTLDREIDHHIPYEPFLFTEHDTGVDLNINNRFGLVIENMINERRVK
jgi:cellulose biosynthesis protein BcsQ